MEEAGTLPNSYYEASITLISKLDKDITREVKRQTTIYYEYRYINPQRDTSKPNPATYERDYKS